MQEKHRKTKFKSNTPSLPQVLPSVGGRVHKLRKIRLSKEPQAANTFCQKSQVHSNNGHKKNVNQTGSFCLVSILSIPLWGCAKLGSSLTQGTRPTWPSFSSLSFGAFRELAQSRCQATLLMSWDVLGTFQSETEQNAAFVQGLWSFLGHLRHCCTRLTAPRQITKSPVPWQLWQSPQVPPAKRPQKKKLRDSHLLRPNAPYENSKKLLCFTKC